MPTRRNFISTKNKSYDKFALFTTQIYFLQRKDMNFLTNKQFQECFYLLLKKTLYKY
jgi:hypothetical protein